MRCTKQVRMDGTVAVCGRVGSYSASAFTSQSLDVAVVPVTEKHPGAVASAHSTSLIRSDALQNASKIHTQERTARLLLTRFASASLALLRGCQDVCWDGSCLGWSPLACSAACAAAQHHRRCESAWYSAYRTSMKHCTTLALCWLAP